MSKHTLNPVIDLDRWHDLQLHPLCEVFPPSAEEDYQELVKSMHEQGYHSSDPIVLIDVADEDSPDKEFQILDGRNRYLAAMDAKVTPSFVEYVGEDPLAFVTARNLARRHLTTGQKAALAASLAGLQPGQNAHSPTDITQPEAAKKVGVGEATVRRYKKLEREHPELAEAVKRGEMTLEQARKKAEEPPPAKSKREELAEKALRKKQEREAAKAAKESSPAGSTEPIKPKESPAARMHEEANSRLKDIVEAIAIEHKVPEELRPALLSVAARAYLLGREVAKQED